MLVCGGWKCEKALKIFIVWCGVCSSKANYYNEIRFKNVFAYFYAVG